MEELSNWEALQWDAYRNRPSVNSQVTDSELHFLVQFYSQPQAGYVMGMSCQLQMSDNNYFKRRKTRLANNGKSHVYLNATMAGGGHSRIGSTTSNPLLALLLLV